MMMSASCDKNFFFTDHSFEKKINFLCFEKCRNFDFFPTLQIKELFLLKISICGFLGVLWVLQALFLKIFEKFENFRMFSIPWSFPLDKYLLTYWKVKVSENAIFLRYFQNLHLQVWVRCGCAKPFFQKFLKSSKILEYFPYLDHFHSTKTRWHIGRSKSVKNPYFLGGGVLFGFFFTFLGTWYCGPMIWKKILRSLPILVVKWGVLGRVLARGVRTWNFEGLYTHIRPLFTPSAGPSMCTQQAQPWSFWLLTLKIRGKWDLKIGPQKL